MQRGVIEEGRQIKQELDGYKKTLERIKILVSLMMAKN